MTEEKSNAFPPDTAAQILGLVERDSEGILVQTEKGKQLQLLLESLPEEERKKAAAEFLKQ